MVSRFLKAFFIIALVIAALNILSRQSQRAANASPRVHVRQADPSESPFPQGGGDSFRKGVVTSVDSENNVTTTPAKR